MEWGDVFAARRRSVRYIVGRGRWKKAKRVDDTIWMGKEGAAELDMSEHRKSKKRQQNYESVPIPKARPTLIA